MTHTVDDKTLVCILSSPLNSSHFTRFKCFLTRFSSFADGQGRQGAYMRLHRVHHRRLYHVLRAAVEQIFRQEEDSHQGGLCFRHRSGFGVFDDAVNSTRYARR